MTAINRYVQFIIEDLRRSTENEEFSDQIGIPDVDFLRYLNDAQKRIYSLISNTHPQVFLKDVLFNINPKQESVDLPYDVHLGNKISDIKYSTILNNQNSFERLYPMYQRNRTARYDGYPCQYLRKSGKVFLYPTPQNSGLLKLTYAQSVPDLAIRAGMVDTVTITNNVITALNLNITTEEIDDELLAKYTRVCIVDDEGNIKAANIRITGIDQSTGQVIIHPSHVLSVTETIEPGDFIVPGQYTTTHSHLDPLIERYLMSYCSVKVMQQEGSNELAEEMTTLQMLEQDIVDSYSDISDDIIEIPNIISDEDEWY